MPSSSEHLLLLRVPVLTDSAANVLERLVGRQALAPAAKLLDHAVESFHFVLNNYVVKDNRIPPRGFQRAAFASRLCAPVGADYADGQYWDELEFPMPAGTAQVEFRLMYQSVSWEYLKFLVEENKTDSWGKDLYEAWEQTGKCPPEEIAFVAKRVNP